MMTFIYSTGNLSSPSAVFLTMFGTYGTYLFVLSGTYFGGMLAGGCLLLAYVLLKPILQGRHSDGRVVMLAGSMTGLAALAEYTSVVVIPLWAALLILRRRRFKEVALFLAGVLPILILFLHYNYLTTGTPFDLTYHHQAAEEFAPMREPLIGFGMPRIEALWGLTFSPFRGIFFYAPVLLLVASLFLGRLWRGRKGLLTGNLLVLPVLVHLLAISCFYMWWGGWSYGPRHLAPLALPVVFEGLLQISRLNPSRWAFLILAFWGVLAGWMAKATRVYMMPGDVKNPLFDLVLPDLIQMKFNANNLPSLLFGISPGPAVFLWPLLFVASVFWLTEWHRRLIASQGVPVLQGEGKG